MTDFVICPPDNTVVIDGEGATGVDMSGIPIGINAIQWYEVRNNGEISYLPDPYTGVLAPNEVITDYSAFQPQLDQANEIIFARNNPDYYYSTTSDLIWQGQPYPLGAEIIIDTPNTPPPAQSTPDVPPTPEEFQNLYWYNDAWVVSPFNPALDLAGAQAYLTTVVEANGASNVNTQARIYSVLELIQAPTPGDLICADYPTYSLSAYQTYIDGAVSDSITLIDGATSTEELYDFDTRIDPNPV